MEWVVGIPIRFGDTDRLVHAAQIRKEMFNTSGGVVVGGIGQLSASYPRLHQKLDALMQEMIPQYPEGTLLVDIEYDIRNEFMTRYPEHKDYALGIICIGSAAKLKTNSISAVPGEVTVIGDFNLRGFVTGGATGKIKFSLPRNDHVSLKVYDLRGRLVSTLVEGLMTEGEHETNFSSDRMASGMYFLALQVGDEFESAKITLVK